MSQYALTFELPAVFSEDNFFVSGCNRDAYAWISAWPDWPGLAMILCGPKGSGKSHLAHIWAEKSNAVIASGLAPDTQMSSLLIENIEEIREERQLLHLLNYSKENGYALLLTSSLPPRELPFRLPDLTSRLNALPLAHIAPPDDEALAGAMRKQFADRQLKVEEDVVAYLLPRMERSFSGVRETVEKLDAAAMAERKPVTVPFVKKALGF